MISLPVPRLVVVVDRAGCRREISTTALGALEGGADQIQLREPDLDNDEYACLAASLLEAGVPPSRLTVNGRPEVARRLGANLHLPERMAGLAGMDGFALKSQSVHGERAPGAGQFDYLIAGNALETGSKPGKAGLGPDSFGGIVRSAACPVLAIGGMTPETLGAFMHVGAYGVAVRSYVISSADPAQATCAIKKEIERWTR